MHRMDTMTTVRLLGLLLAASLLITACDPTADPAADDADTSGTEEGDEQDTAEAEDDAGGERVERLRLAGGDYGQPTPFAWVRGPGRIHAGFLFDTLMWRDGSGEFGPWLAEDWETSDDGRQWTFTLHQGIEWHDGEALTAEDVAFTFDYYTDGPGGDVGAGSGLDVVDDVVAEDERTVVFELPEPYAAFAEDVAGRMMIVPEHVWAGVDDPGQYVEDDAYTGSGPYELAELDAAAGTYLYEANDDFFLGEPHVQRLEFIPEVDDELLALEQGELDAAEVAREPVPEEQFTAFDAQYGFLEGSGDWNHALHFNLDEGFPYDERDFRHAVAYAIDREDLVERKLFGRGQPGSPGGLAPDHPLHADDLPAYERDLERAEELLDGLDLTDSNDDGVRELPDGEPFEIELLSSERFGSQDPELVAEYLGDVGLDVEVAMRDRSTADEAGEAGTYSMALHGYGGLMSDPDGLRARYHSDAPPRGHSTVHGYANEEFDELAEAQLSTVDPDERAELVADMQRILAEDLPVLSLYVPTRFLFYDEAVFDGWYYTPGCSPCRGSRNKHMYVTGQETGLPAQGS